MWLLIMLVISQKKPNELTEVEKSWLAAIIDGEGYLPKINNEYVHPVMSIANTCEELIQYAYSLIDGGCFHSILPKSSFGRKRQYFVTLAKRNNLKDLLCVVTPYLIVKKAKAEALIDWIDKHPASTPKDMTPARLAVFQSEHYKTIKRIQGNRHRDVETGRFISVKAGPVL